MTTSLRETTVGYSHVHLTRYIQEGFDVRRFLELMATPVERAARRRDRVWEGAHA